MKTKTCFKIATMTFICLLGLINTGNLIPDNQNPVLIYSPNTNDNSRFDVRFSFDSSSPGLAYNQYLTLVFPFNAMSDLSFDQGQNPKFSCSLTDGTINYTVTADKPLSSSEGNYAYCKFTDVVNNTIKSGTKLTLSVSLIGVKISSNFLRSLKLFTATSNKTSKMIIDQLYFLGNIALYADPLTYATKSIDITSSSFLIGSSVVQSIFPYQTFDISLNIKSNIFIGASDLLFVFRYDSNLVSPAQSAISNSLNLGSSNDPLSAAIKGSLSITTSLANSIVVLSGITEDLIPNRQFQLVLKSWKALDKSTNNVRPLEMMVYYKNTYSLISYVNSTTFKISPTSIILTAGHPDAFDIFRSGVFPMKFSFSTNYDLSNGGYVLIQQSNTIDLVSRFNFVAATCDFSDNDNNFDQGFGKRPNCFPIRTDFNYSASSSTGYNGSGIFFYIKNLQANKTYYVTVWGSADACGGSSITNFNSAVSSSNVTNYQFQFQATVYNTITPTAVNESRFASSTILGQSVPQSMSNKCWNSQIQFMNNMDSTHANNSPANIPFMDSVYQTSIKVTDSGRATAKGTFDCDPTNTNSSSAYCKLSSDINLYKEFYNLQLVNFSSPYVANSAFDDFVANNAITENFIYGSTQISNTSYFGLVATFPILPTTKIYEYIPSPLAFDPATGGAVASIAGGAQNPWNMYRVLPGRLELKVSKSWFTTGDSAIGTSPGCYMSWGIDLNVKDSTNTTNMNTNRIMKSIVTPRGTPVTNGHDCPLNSTEGQVNFITSYANTAFNSGGYNCSTAVASLDITNSSLPSANNASTVSNYKILSSWNATAGFTGSGAGTAETRTIAGSLGSTVTNSSWNFPLPLTAMITTLNPTGTPKKMLQFGLFSSCLKWSPPSTIKSLYASIDIQLNWLLTYDANAVSYTAAPPHRAMRFIKLFPEGGVFQDISGSGNASRTLSNSSLDQTTAVSTVYPRSYKLHYSIGLTNQSVGVCLIEINSTALANTSDSSSSVLAIWIGFGVILETDYTDLTSNYPVAPLNSTTYNSYGLQSGYFMNNKENFNVHNNFAENDAFVKVNDSSANAINKFQLRNLLVQLANTGSTINATYATTGATNYGTSTDYYVNSDIRQANRSSYLFLMGSLVLITGITSNSITTNSNADYLMIPIYCPIHDITNSVGTLKQINGLPTLYMSFISMTAFNSITSINRIYSHKSSDGVSGWNQTIITSSSHLTGLTSDYYRASANIVNTNLFGPSSGSTATSQEYLFTLRWAPYTSTVTNNDNILYFYYGNNASSTNVQTNQNCTGHVVLIDSTNISIDTNNLKAGGFNNVTSPYLYNGSKKFYYLGFGFNKSIFMGLGAANTGTNANSVGGLSTQSLTQETSNYNLTGIKRPAVDVFYQNGNFVNPFNTIAYFCNSAHKSYNEIFSNYITYPAAFTKSFIVDFNPPVGSPRSFTVTITQDKSETIYKNDVAGNTKLNIVLPTKIPGATSLKFNAALNSFSTNTICGLVTIATQPVIECGSLNSNLIVCPTNRSDVNYTICCYNVSIASDTFSLNTLYASIPAAPNSNQTTRYNIEKLLDASPQMPTPGFSWTTSQSTGTDVIGSLSAKITKVDYSQVVQDSGIGKVTFTVTLPREPTRNMALTLVGDFSAMLVQNSSPRCLATFGTGFGSNWDTSGDILLEACDVSNFSGSTAPVLITTKNIVYKCGLSFASKTIYVSLWPIIQVNWSNNPFSSNNYKVTMTLNNSSFDAVANNSATFNISTNLTYSTKPGVSGQWDTLCTVSSVTPKIPGEYADYQFDFDLDTNKSALSNANPNEISIFFPYLHYGASIPNVLCFNNNASLNCYFSDEGILNIRFTSNLPVGSGKKISIVVTGIYNPSFENDIWFPCTVNNTNFATNLRVNLLTGSGKLTGGIPLPTSTAMGALRFINLTSISDNNPRNVSTHVFRITFDSAIGLTNYPITIGNTPQIIITFPKEYNLSWYTTVKATATIEEYTNDTTNIVTKTATLNPASVSQSGNRVTINLSPTSYTFNTNWRYWDLKISNITGPTDSTSGSSNSTTGAFSVILTNSNYSSIYRIYSNLNTSAFNNLSVPIDNWVNSNRGVEFKFDNTRWVIDINTSGVFNNLTIRPGRFFLSTFTVKSNPSSSIQPQSTSISLNDQNFKLADSSYNIATGLNQPVTFYIGTSCSTAPGKYIINFTLAGTNTNSFFTPLAPVQITLDNSNPGLASFSTPAAIPAAASTLIYYSLSEPNVDALTISWTNSPTTKNDSTANISQVTIPASLIPAGTNFSATLNNFYSIFSITNIQGTNNQLFVPNALNNCYSWSSNLLTISISGSQAIIPNNFDFTSSFKYSNSDNDSTVTIKNSIKFSFTPPYSPIYIYCALACYNRNYPTDDVIRSTTNNLSSDNLTRYYTNMFTSKSPTDIVFDNLVRGQRYKLRCIISSTEGNTAIRTSAAISIEQLNTSNGTASQFAPSSPTKTQCVQYYFTSDPGQATKIAIINYCQKLFSQNGWSSNGCVICTDSGLTYTSPGLFLPSNITCLASSSKSRLRFLQTTTTPTNSTVITPTTAGSTVNPSLVNQSNPITFSVCPLQHPVCPSDVSGNKLYVDYFNQLISDTKTTALFNSNLGIVNVPINSTLIVTDSVAPDISKNFIVNILSLNGNGLVQWSASFTSALKCSWQIAETSLAPSSGSAIDSCADVQWCGKNFNVGTIVSNTSNNINNLKAFTSGKTYGLYFACYNDVPYSTSISNVFNVPLSIPSNGNNNPATPTNNNNTTTNTTGNVSAVYNLFNYAILLILALLI